MFCTSMLCGTGMLPAAPRCSYRVVCLVFKLQVLANQESHPNKRGSLCKGEREGQSQAERMFSGAIYLGLEAKLKNRQGSRYCRSILRPYCVNSQVRKVAELCFNIWLAVSDLKTSDV